MALSLNLITYLNDFDTNTLRLILGSFIGIPCGLILNKSLKIIFLNKEKTNE